MTTDPLPAAADAAHLTEALRKSGVLGQSRVRHVAVEKSFATVLSHFFQLRLTYDDGAVGAPASLILKAGLPGRAGGPWIGGRHEVAFYTEVAATMPAGYVPRCFGAHWDPDTGAWDLLFEDLSESHFVATQWPLPPTLAQCESIIRMRARFHAAWWDDARLGVKVGAWQDAGAAEQSTKSLMEQYASFADDLGERLSAERRELYVRLFDAAPRLTARYHSHHHMTIVQGDAHVWNCFLPRAGGTDAARLFDWDAWRVDVGSDDLAYMMAIHWYPDLRHRFERHLLDCYHDELVARGVQDYDRRALQEDYRLSVLWQTTTPIWQHAAGIPPVIWWNNLERIHLAVDDLGCRDLMAG
jgi:Ecdysteroid kinase-like family